MASSGGPVMECLRRLGEEAVEIRPFLPTYLHLVVSSLFPIFTGAHASLSRPSSADEPPKREERAKKGEDEDEEESEDEDQLDVRKMESLSPSDAITFPILAGLTLTSLYFIIKWLKDPAILNRILGYYFSTMGFFFAVRFVKDALIALRSFFFPNLYSRKGVVWKAKGETRRFEALTENDGSSHAVASAPGIVQRSLWNVRNILYTKVTARMHLRSVFAWKTHLDTLDLIGGASSIVAVLYFMLVGKPWWLTNFMGFSFCYGTLQFMSPTTFWTGTLLLSSLFFYDIYFVFFTPLMVTVATKLDIPIKLLFPRPAPTEDDPSAMGLAMLGLGDIVIPGMMIGLALRFDLYMYYLRKQSTSPTDTFKLESSTKSSNEVVTKGEALPNTSKSDNAKAVIKAKYLPATGSWGERFWTGTTISPELEGKRFPKPYFYASLLGYVVGMLVTLGVMQIAQHAQPALLYLVPGVLIPLWGTAAWRGEFLEMWRFSEATDEDEDDKAAKKKKEKQEQKEAELKEKEGAGPSGKKQKLVKTEKEGSEAKASADTNAASDKTQLELKKKKLDEVKSRTLFSLTLTLPTLKKSSPPPSPPTITGEGSSPSLQFSDERLMAAGKATPNVLSGGAGNVNSVRQQEEEEK